MDWKYPLICEPLLKAKLYALESMEYTHNHPGWENQTATVEKLNRITTGRFGQIWIDRFCNLNAVSCTPDNSSSLEVDQIDLEICGYAIDVKTSVAGKIRCQVNKSLENKPCDFFLFIETDRRYSFIQPRGFISKQEYFKGAQLIRKGEFIPGTNWQQRFDGGTFVMPESCDYKDFLLPFHDTLEQWKQRYGGARALPAFSGSSGALVGAR